MGATSIATTTAPSMILGIISILFFVLWAGNSEGRVFFWYAVSF